MTDKDNLFVERLKRAVTPDLAKAAENVRKLGKSAVPFKVNRNTVFLMANDESQARRKLSLERRKQLTKKGTYCPTYKDKSAIWDCGRAQYVKYVAAAEKTVYDMWRKTLKKGDERLKIPQKDMRFYMSMHAGRATTYASAAELVYKHEYSWRVSAGDRATRPSGQLNWSFITAKFVDDLYEGDEFALFLNDHGFDNAVYIDNVVCFIVREYRSIHVAHIRGSWRFHRHDGPALESSNSLNDKFFFRGVQFRTERRWSETTKGYVVEEPEFSSMFNPDGTVRLRPREIISGSENAEQRRVLLETFSPDELLADCDAKRIDGPTAAGNELLSVDIGIPPEYNWQTRQNEPRRALMLRYKCPSTDRTYAKFVPPTIKSADEAQAWSHHFTLEEYANIKAQS